MSEEKKIQSVSEAGQPKSKYDFSKVNLVTGEGMQTEYSSLEEMSKYLAAFAEECERAGILE
jgi:hypothetical protein